MATRRSHTKSRNGCRDCKRRKVKCDEAYPSCFNCTRHGITCSLSNSGSSPNDIAPLRPYAPSATHSLSPDGKFDFLDMAADRGRVPPPLATLEICGRGLELMHHYALVTGDSLATRQDMRHVWRVIVPEIAYGCPFLMHGILTLSALHKAYLIPSERQTYLDLATSHQNTGLEGFRAALHTLNDSNWESFFCFASLVVMYVASVPVRMMGADADQGSNILEVFVFVRGIRAVIEPYQARLLRTRFSPLIHGTWTIDPKDPNYRNPPMHQSPLPRDTFQALQDLSAFFRESLAGESREEYLTAVEELEKAIYLMAHASTHLEVGMLLFWPYVVSEGIMADIQAQNPYAAVLLAYFAIPLCVLEQRFWFLKGWSRRMMAMMDACLEDHPALMEVAKWPKRQIVEVYGMV